MKAPRVLVGNHEPTLTDLVEDSIKQYEKDRTRKQAAQIVEEMMTQGVAEFSSDLGGVFVDSHASLPVFDENKNRLTEFDSITHCHGDYPLWSEMEAHNKLEELLQAVKAGTLADDDTRLQHLFMRTNWVGQIKTNVTLSTVGQIRANLENGRRLLNGSPILTQDGKEVMAHSVQPRELSRMSGDPVTCLTLDQFTRCNYYMPVAYGLQFSTDAAEVLATGKEPSFPILPVFWNPHKVSSTPCEGVSITVQPLPGFQCLFRPFPSYSEYLPEIPSGGEKGEITQCSFYQRLVGGYVGLDLSHQTE